MYFEKYIVDALKITGISSVLGVTILYLTKSLISSFINQYFDLKKLAFQAELAQQTEQFKSGLNKEVEAYKSILSKEFEAYKVKYNNIYAKQAAAIEEMYMLIVKIESNIKNFSMIHMPLEESAEKRNLSREVFSEIRDLFSIYLKHKLYFPQEINSLIESLVDLNNKNFKEITINENLIAENDISIITDKLNIMKITLDNEFRKILGIF